MIGNGWKSVGQLIINTQILNAFFSFINIALSKEKYLTISI